MALLHNLAIQMGDKMRLAYYRSVQHCTIQHLVDETDWYYDPDEFSNEVGYLLRDDQGNLALAKETDDGYLLLTVETDNDISELQVVVPFHKLDEDEEQSK